LRFRSGGQIFQKANLRYAKPEAAESGQILGLGDQGEFDAFAHGVDAFGADADLVAEFRG
jgi:hypothetical protein